MLTASRANKRFPIPRWRSLEAEIASSELGDARASSQMDGAKAPEFVERLEQWRLKHGILESAELVETAVILGEEQEAVGAARILLAAKSKVPDLVRQNAALLMQRAGLDYEVDSDAIPKPRTGTAIWRTYLKSHPRNALAWSELARVQLAEGFANRSAERSMLIAMQLAPFNRHILRSAARMYVHLDEAEHAYLIIKRNDATPRDVWLMAAEVALAGTIGKAPTHYKRAVEALEAQLQPRQITELASALGTQLLCDGAIKKSKRLFKQSMVAPNGNSLAQAEWASNQFGERLVDQGKLAAKDSSEAWARRRYWSGDFAGAFADAVRWSNEEPISWLAYRGAASAAFMLEEPDKAEAILKRGLRHSPKSQELRLDLAFAWASQNRLDEAESVFDSIDVSADDNKRYIIEANRGLVALRRGELDQGRLHYKNAIRGFRVKGLTENEYLARAYFAKEAASAGLSDTAALIKDVEPKGGVVLASTTSHVLEKAKSILAERHSG
jgi:tetratricopeptide (TPR) repeat protein